MINCFQKFEISGQQQVVLRLTGRTHGDLQKPGEIYFGVPAAAFGDVCGNRDSRTADLAGETVDLVRRESCTCLVDGQRQFMSLFPDLQGVKVPQSGNPLSSPKMVTLHGFSFMMRLRKQIRRIAVERFLKRHEGRIKGIISGFDRLRFKATFRSIRYSDGLDKWLGSRHKRLVEFGDYMQELSGRIKEHAQAFALKHGRPHQYLHSPKVSKEEIALEIAQQDGIREGLICVLTCVEPCRTFSLKTISPKTKHIGLRSADRQCLHVYFYYLDREFGLMHVRLQTWVPFTIHVCLNGWDWLAGALTQAGIPYEKRDNCFTHIDDIPRAQELMNSLLERNWVSFLNHFARDINPWYTDGDPLSLGRYDWTLAESEFSSDIIFKSKEDLQAVYPALLNHAIEHFHCHDVLRFLGRKVRSAFDGEIKSDFKLRQEGTRIRHWVQENSIKMYDKQGCVLRVETTINNPRRWHVWRRVTRQGKRCGTWIPMRRSVADIRRRAEVSRAANFRYLDALAVVGDSLPAREVLDPLAQRKTIHGRPYRPLHPIAPADAVVLAAVSDGRFLVNGFRNRDIRGILHPQAALDADSLRKSSGRVSRTLSLLRAHGLIFRVQKTARYRLTRSGLTVTAAVTRLRTSNVGELVH